MIQLGDTVLYNLTADDAEQINRRREHALGNMDMIRTGKFGYQVHFGNDVAAGQVVPVIVTRVHPARRINGQAILDGTDNLWVLNVAEGYGPGYWFNRD